MHVYKITFQTWEFGFRTGDGAGDRILATNVPKYVMAESSLKAVETLRARFRQQLEVSSIEHVCRVDEVQNALA